MKILNTPLAWLARLSFPGVILAGILLTGGIILWGQFKQQILEFLPYLFILLCPLMHVFMHRGHHGHSGQTGERKQIVDGDHE